jgi:zinc D-Ala-D-Ala carboxypeptidase
VRYPQGMEGVTGYEWEPWHVRYVGVEVATAMHETGVTTLEELFGTGAAPDYG